MTCLNMSTAAKELKQNKTHTDDTQNKTHTDYVLCGTKHSLMVFNTEQKKY